VRIIDSSEIAQIRNHSDSCPLENRIRNVKVDKADMLRQTIWAIKTHAGTTWQQKNTWKVAAAPFEDRLAIQ
jgi:hypothetical protein